MGCGCKCGRCPNAFQATAFDVGRGVGASALAARYEQEESELERAKRSGFARQTALRRPQGGRRTMSHASSPHGPAGHADQKKSQGKLGYASKAQGNKKPGGMRRTQQKAGYRAQQKSGFPGGPGPARGHKGSGRLRGSVAPPGGPGPLIAPNAVLLNRRYADRLGWRAYYNPILALLGPTAIGGEAAFVQAVAEWQATKGLPSNGILGPVTWNQIQADLAASPDAGSPASPLTGGAPPLAPSPEEPDAAEPLGEVESEYESAHRIGRPASRRWAHCPPSAETPPTERTVLAVTSRLATGKPFACTVSAHDGISMGTIRWNLRDGTLQRLLARFENRSGRLIRYFGSDYDRLMGLIGLRRSERQRSRAVAAATAERLADRWRGRLLSLVSDATFYSMMMQDIRGHLAAAKGSARRLGLWTVRGLTLIFDIAACQGLSPAKIECFAARLRRLEATRGALSEQEKLVAIAEESVRGLARHRDERRARRMVIATGSGPARGRWWDLGRDYANLDAPWES